MRDAVHVCPLTILARSLFSGLFACAPALPSPATAPEPATSATCLEGVRQGTTRPGWVLETRNVDRPFVLQSSPSEVLRPAMWSFDIYQGSAHYDEVARCFSRAQRLLNAVQLYMGETNNGGHEQFFYNNAGLTWPDALEALEELGLHDVHALLTQALGRFPSPPSRDTAERRQQLQDTAPDFGDIDERFHNENRSVELEQAMRAYMQRNPDAFLFEGVIEVPKY